MTLFFYIFLASRIRIYFEICCSHAFLAQYSLNNDSLNDYSKQLLLRVILLILLFLCKFLLFWDSFQVDGLQMFPPGDSSVNFTQAQCCTRAWITLFLVFSHGEMELKVDKRRIVIVWLELEQLLNDLVFSPSPFQISHRPSGLSGQHHVDHRPLVPISDTPPHPQLIQYLWVRWLKDSGGFRSTLVLAWYLASAVCLWRCPAALYDDWAALSFPCFDAQKVPLIKKRILQHLLLTICPAVLDGGRYRNS